MTKGDTSPVTPIRWPDPEQVGAGLARAMLERLGIDSTEVTDFHVDLRGGDYRYVAVTRRKVHTDHDGSLYEGAHTSLIRIGSAPPPPRDADDVPRTDWLRIDLGDLGVVHAVGDDIDELVTSAAEGIRALLTPTPLDRKES